MKEAKALKKSGDVCFKKVESFSVKKRLMAGWAAERRLFRRNAFIPARATPVVPETTADPIRDSGVVLDPMRAASMPVPRAVPTISQACLATKFLPMDPTSREALSSVVAERNEALERSISAIRAAF